MHSRESLADAQRRHWQATYRAHPSWRSRVDLLTNGPMPWRSAGRRRARDFERYTLAGDGSLHVSGLPNWPTVITGVSRLT